MILLETDKMATQDFYSETEEVYCLNYQILAQTSGECEIHQLKQA